MRLISFVEPTMLTLNSKNTERAYRRALTHFASWHALNGEPKLARDTVVAYMNELKEVKPGMSSQFYVQTLSAIKKLCEYLSDERKLDHYKYIVIAAIKADSVKSEPTGTLVANEDLAAIFKVCLEESKPIGVRDASIIATLHATGMRRSECTNLEMTDLKTGFFLLRDTKNNEQRRAYLNDGARRYLARWLTIRGQDDGPVYLKIKGKKDDQEVLREPLNEQAIYSLLRKRMKQADIEKPYTPHDFRKTFISRQLEAGTDIPVIAKMTGHRAWQTIEKYDLGWQERMKKAAGAIETPFVEV